MTNNSAASSQPAPIPPDDRRRDLALARPEEDHNLPHIWVSGDTYTVLLTGEDTAGRYCLIDMYVPPGGGPPPHKLGHKPCDTEVPRAWQKLVETCEGSWPCG